MNKVLIPFGIAFWAFLHYRRQWYPWMVSNQKCPCCLGVWLDRHGLAGGANILIAGDLCRRLEDFLFGPEGEWGADW